jgi:hypothetical protein
MTRRGGLHWIVLVAFVLGGCEYVVMPPEESPGVVHSSKGWSAVATAVAPAESGDLRIDLAIRNETGDWSAMAAVAGEPAVLTTGDGSRTDCTTVFVGSGGHRLAPGFRMQGFIAGPKTKPRMERIRVECAGATAAPGSKLAIDYAYVTGEYDYYDAKTTGTEGTLEVNLDEAAADLTFPIAEPIDGLIQPADSEIPALNDVTLTLADVVRTDEGFEFTWQTSNPGEYPTIVHVGNPPVIGTDGILYGFYESPDLASAPVTPPGDVADWTTEVAVPAHVKGFYIMLSVEAKKQRTFVNHAVDISDR